MKTGRKRRKKPKISTKRPIIYILCILLVILIFTFGFYILKIVNLNHSNKFIVESRVKNVNSAKDKDSRELKTVGWLRVQGTNIDYPVYYGPNYNFNVIPEDFAWTEADYKELNNIIYISGHNIKNLSKSPLITNKKHSRFEQLMSFTYYDFAKDNQFIQYTFNGKEYVYQIFSVSYVSFFELNNLNKDRYSDEIMNEYIKRVKELSLYDYDVDVNVNDSLIVLDTCTRMFENDDNMHFRVVGRLVRKGEKLTNKDIHKTKKYKEIEDIMKGGDSYDEA